MPRLLALACACLFSATAVAAPQKLLTAATIRTSDPARPLATALVWDDSGRLLDVGDARVLRGKYPRAERIDAGQATVIPGLIDAHGHVMGLGYALMRADLVGTRDKAEVVRRLRDYAAPGRTMPGCWAAAGTRTTGRKKSSPPPPISMPPFPTARSGWSAWTAMPAGPTAPR